MKFHFGLPDLWKLANVLPVPKDWTPTASFNMLRPISITAVIMRLFERLIFTQEMPLLGMINSRTRRDVTLLWPYYVINISG